VKSGRTAAIVLLAVDAVTTAVGRIASVAFIVAMLVIVCFLVPHAKKEMLPLY
jgi:hypothetical protein